MDNRKKILLTFVAILAITSLIIGGTYAYILWSSNENQSTEVTFTVDAGFTCGADAGGHITSSDRMLAPTDCTDSQYAIQRTITTNVTNSRSSSVYMDLWLDINNISSALSASNNFKYALTTQANNCTSNVIESGTFTGLTNGDKVALLEGDEYASSSSNTYYLYIWLDEAETNHNTMNQSFDLSIGGQCSDNYVLKPNKPVLDTGMIPVKISDTGVVTAVSENDDTWFNYDNKQWANAVLVKENGVKSRSANKNDLTTIDQSDILAYFVWIPRYSYKVWQYSGVAETVPNPPPSIDIKFVKKNIKELATQNGEWYTHPAFTFGNTELAGIWVGKFETSTDATSTCYTTPSETNCSNTNQLPRIVPTVDSLRYQTVSNQFQTALKFAGGSMTNNVVTFVGSTWTYNFI